jgi:GNAT superfamily N-acetyltransferase
VLDILAVDPQFMRRGVGSALLSWGTALADEARWFTWLESTPVGYPVYIGYGFEAVDTHDLEIVKRFGALRREGEDWGETTALEVLGPLPPGHFRTPMLRRAPR